MMGEVLSPCPVCKGTGVIRNAVEYPSLEDQRCCPQCKAGRTLAEAIARIVARARTGERAQVA
jgi:hypothetical protein